jgi:hypothetical protein
MSNIIDKLKEAVKPTFLALALTSAAGCAPVIVRQYVPYEVPGPVNNQTNQAVVNVYGDRKDVRVIINQGNENGSPAEADITHYEYKRGTLKRIPCGTPDGR